MSQNQILVIGKNDKINVKNFDNIDEFNDYYNLHESEINELSTVKLNKMFKIKDFKIARRKNDSSAVKKLYFIQQMKPTNQSTNNDDLNERIEELETSISDLNNKMKNIELENSKIKSQLIEIIKAINSSN